MKRYSIWIGTKRRDGYLASDVADLERRHREAMSYLTALADCGVVHDDPRLDYLDVQVDRKDLVAARVFLAEEADNHTSQ